MALKPEDNALTPEQILHRRNAFNVWLARCGQALGYYRLPATQQFAVHEMLRRAFNAGTNYEARMSLEEQDENIT